MVRSLRSDVRSWPTPTAALGEKGVRSIEGAKTEVERGHGPDLCAVALANWPTPTARDWKSGAASPATLERNSRPLSEFVQAETASDAKASGAAGYSTANRHSGTTLTDATVRQPNVTGSLNPNWVEQLQNLPDGWTDIEVATNPWSLRWPARPGEAQYPWEAPRVAVGIKNRPKRLKALGNAVVPAQGLFAALRLMEIIEGL